MRHPRYCLTYHPGISSYITNATHISTPPTLPKLAHRSLAIHAGTSPQHVTQVNHTGMLPMLARHHRKHTTHASTPATLARHPRHSHQHEQHMISQTLGYPIKFLKLLALKFQEESQQFLLLFFILIAFTFQAFLSVFIEAWITTKNKQTFLEETSLPYSKDDYFFKKKSAIFSEKKLFANISLTLAILYI